MKSKKIIALAKGILAFCSYLFWPRWGVAASRHVPRHDSGLCPGVHRYIFRHARCPGLEDARCRWRRLPRLRRHRRPILCRPASRSHKTINQEVYFVVNLCSIIERIPRDRILTESDAPSNERINFQDYYII